MRRIDDVNSGRTEPKDAFDIAQEWISVGLNQGDGLGCFGEQNCQETEQPNVCPEHNRIDIASIQGSGTVVHCFLPGQTLLRLRIQHKVLSPKFCQI